MTYDWSEFLEFAKALEADPSSPGPQEAALRSAASRAYYAAFNEALRFAQLEGYDPMQSSNVHAALRKFYWPHKSRDARRRRIADQLKKCWDQRRRADYDPEPHAKPEYMAVWAIGMAENVLNELESLRHTSE